MARVVDDSTEGLNAGGEAGGQTVRPDGAPEHGEPGAGRSMTARATFILVAKTLAFALNTALPIILVRRLSQYEFGLYKQIFLVVGTALNTLPLGFGMSAFYFLPRERTRKSQVALNLLLFHLLVSAAAAAVLVLDPGLLATLFNAPEIAEQAPRIGVLVFLWVGSYFIETVVVANDEVGLASILIVALQWTRTLLLVGAALLFGSIGAIVDAAILQGVLQLLVLLVYLRSRFGKFWRAFDWSMARLQLAYAIPLGLAGTVQQIRIDMPQYFVSSAYGVSEYAIYSVGCFNLPLFGILSGAIGSVMIPRVSYLQSIGDRAQIVRLTAEMTRKLAFVIFPSYVFLSVAARDFIEFLFTPAYLPSVPIFLVYLTLVPFIVLDSACDPVLRAYAEHRYFVLRVRLVVVAVLALGLWLVARPLGLVPTIAVVVVVSILERVSVATRVVRVLEIGRRELVYFTPLAKITIAAIVSGAVTLLARVSMSSARPLFVLLVCAPVFSVVYLALALALGVVTPEERTIIPRAIARLRSTAH